MGIGLGCVSLTTITPRNPPAPPRPGKEPTGGASISVEVSAEHESTDLERAVAAFIKVGRAYGVI
jgi:hypothetical protein